MAYTMAHPMAYPTFCRRAKIWQKGLTTIREVESLILAPQVLVIYHYICVLMEQLSNTPIHCICSTSLNICHLYNIDIQQYVQLISHIWIALQSF